MEIFVRAFEDGVFLDVNDNVEITGGPAAHAGIAIATGSKARTFIDPSWDAQLDPGRFLGPTFTVAVVARLGNALPSSATIRTGLLDLEESA
jgi:hypothetical protein